MGSTAKLLENVRDDNRQLYLERFADREGSQFLARFYRKYKNKKADEALGMLLEGVRLTPKRLAAIFRLLQPDIGIETFTSLLHSHLPDWKHSGRELRKLYDSYTPDAISLADRGYIAHVHPLELWTAAFLNQNPQA